MSGLIILFGATQCAGVPRYLQAAASLALCLATLCRSRQQLTEGVDDPDSEHVRPGRQYGSQIRHE